MEIDGLSGASAGAAASGGVGNPSLGREDFLKMLIAQLENQDPLNPQDATAFTAQLATFSSLEQLIEIRASVDRMEKLLEGAVLPIEPAPDPIDPARNAEKDPA